MSNPLAGGHAGESPYRYDPAARLSLTAGYETCVGCMMRGRCWKGDDDE